MENFQPLVSFLIPSRKRLDMLKASLDSLRETCADPKNIEAIVIFDEDDLKTIESFKELKFDFKVLQIISKRFGYYGLHHYINNAFTISSGKWFWLWNDDLKMVGLNWDEVISEYGEQFVVLNPRNTHPYWQNYCLDATISPVVPRKWYEITNRFSAYNQYDTYINEVAYPLNLIINEDRLINFHGQVEDEVSAGISYDTVQIPAQECKKDRDLIRDYLGAKRLFIYRIQRTPYRLEKYLRRRKAHFRRMFSIQYLSTRLKPSMLYKKLSNVFFSQKIDKE